MGLFGGFCLVGCGEKKIAMDISALESPWMAMKDEWEGVSGGQVDVGDELSIGWGEALTNVRWKGEVPTAPFELEMKAKRLNGTDFFCAVTFPARGWKNA